MDLEHLAERRDPEVVVGFFDLDGFTEWCRDRSPSECLAFAAEYFKRTGQVIADSGGQVVKAIGDAGLFVFPADDLVSVADALLALKSDSDQWLSERGYTDEMTIKAALGPVACGFVGPPGTERLDVYGETVNRAYLLKSRPVAVDDFIARQLPAPVHDKLIGSVTVDPEPKG